MINPLESAEIPVEHALVIIILNPEKTKALLFRRAKQKVLAGVWAPIAAGPYIATENFREKAEEEAGIESGFHPQIVMEAPTMTIPIDGTTTIIHPFVAIAPESSNVKMNDEHTEYAWVPLADLTQQEYDPRLGYYIGKLLGK